MTRAAADVTDTVNVKKASKPETHTALVRRARKIYRELGEINTAVQTTRLMMFAALGVLALAVVLMARATTTEAKP